MKKGRGSLLVSILVAAILGSCGGGETQSTNSPAYSISGTVMANSSGLEGVTVTLCTSATATTDASGNYSFSGLANGSYTVIPSKSGYVFSPTNMPVTVNGANVSGRDFTGSLTPGPTHSISGSIISNNSGLAGVTVTLSTSSTITTVTTSSSGTYSFPGLTNGVYTIIPSIAGYTFTPTKKSITINSADVTGQDFTGAPKSFLFEKMAGPTIWTNLKRTMAVDSLDQVYVTSGSTIFRVNGSGPLMYLNAATIAAAIGGGASASSLDIRSIDVGPDDKLYILERMYRKILVSDSLGNVAVHRDISDIPGFPQLIGVIDSDNILLINLYDGLWFVRGAGNSLLYDDTLVLGGTNCGTEDFAATFDGHFGYLPGCNQSPVVGGKSDGTGVGILLTNSANIGIGSYYNFSGIGRDTMGGYIVNIDGKRIGRLATTGQFELIHTQPEIDTLAQQMQEDSFGFYYSAIAEGPTGNIYILSTTTLYVAR